MSLEAVMSCCEVWGVAVRPDVVVGARMDAVCAVQRLSVQLWTALADEAQRAVGAASRCREGPREEAS